MNLRIASIVSFNSFDSIASVASFASTSSIAIKIWKRTNLSPQFVQDGK